MDTAMPFLRFSRSCRLFEPGSLTFPFVKGRNMSSASRHSMFSYISNAGN